MENLIPVSYKLLKGMNESVILNIIRKMGPISRADIAKETNLTPPTVTNIVNKLIAENIVMEYKVGESNGGRPPVLIKLNPDFMSIIVIHISTYNLHQYTLDAELKTKKKEKNSIRGLKQEEVLELLTSVLDKAIKESPQNVSGIGIVVRGPVKMKEGISVFAPNIGWRNVPLKSIVEEKFGVSTYVINDVRAMALGEFHMGKAKDVENMIFLKVGYGIGSAILINGRIYTGASDGAGEIGHTTIDVAGPQCSCGNYGCFEALASEKALVNLVVKSIKEGMDSIVYQMAEGMLDSVTPEMIYEAAKLNDKLAVNALKTIGRYLGIGIANTINTFNPELILIGGGIVQARELIEDIIIETAKKRTFENSFSSCRIAFAELGDDATLIGAANMVMDEVL
ncbi:ROK family transcriptional regulator [Thermoanaerobacter thermohydrosulfuricus]|uniref:Transcriptional regulator/sugar kinase n=1 Tax=Thermoanaerobacter thermohydrosulfuricus WC1 TaxID=1198630 RepID=M8CU02_THETY|nr:MULTISPECIES: ROK family transcriptional regulator [Thermoanaerobacter]EMT37919.1 Transcriptional regulator/sugar kinase [Thermoanaerobacter thermohydrosulfuricus WC1]UZQ82377.1 ROK family protein [Thermoanaerobacter sp. RKWS2]SFE63300.1 transcriptional regulator, MarR family [Thermoanaerobacter thermohydrosulfuricus]